MATAEDGNSCNARHAKHSLQQYIRISAVEWTLDFMMRYYHRQIKLKCLTRTKGISILEIIGFRRQACAQENYSAPFSPAMDGNSHHRGKQGEKGLYHRRKSKIHQSVECAGFAGCHHKIIRHHAAIPVLGDI
jgi:hypothetical protein